MIEEYKLIQDFENYEISNLGNVRNKKTGKILSKNIDNHGYYRLNLCKDNKTLAVRIHIMVAQSFLNNVENSKYVEHIDENKLNNNVDNLKFKTKQTYEMRSNKKYNMTDEKIKKIDELWKINFPKMKIMYAKLNNEELVYKKKLTPRLKEFYMQGYGLI